MAGRAPRTRFTADMDEAIRARLAQASPRTRRGEVRQAVGEVAARLGLPPGAVLKRWYRLREREAPPAARRPRQPGTRPHAEPHRDPAGGAASARVTALLAAYHQALARTAARRAELAQAEAELSEAASRLALHLLDGG